MRWCSSSSMTPTGGWPSTPSTAPSRHRPLGAPGSRSRSAPWHSSVPNLLRRTSCNGVAEVQKRWPKPSFRRWRVQLSGPRRPEPRCASIWPWTSTEQPRASWPCWWSRMQRSGIPVPPCQVLQWSFSSRSLSSCESKAFGRSCGPPLARPEDEAATTAASTAREKKAAVFRAKLQAQMKEQIQGAASTIQEHGFNESGRSLNAQVDVALEELRNIVSIRRHRSFREEDALGRWLVSGSTPDLVHAADEARMPPVNGSWDFPLSRAEKTRLLLDLYTVEVQSSHFEIAKLRQESESSQELSVKAEGPSPEQPREEVSKSGRIKLDLAASTYRVLLPIYLPSLQVEQTDMQDGQASDVTSLKFGIYNLTEREFLNTELSLCIPRAGKKESTPASRPRRKFGAAALGAADEDSDDGDGNFHPHGFAKWATARQKIWGIITNEKTDWVLASMILSSRSDLSQLPGVVILIYASGRQGFFRKFTHCSPTTTEEETLQQVTNLITGVYTCVYALEMACRVYVFRTEVFTTAMLFDFLIVAADVLLLVIDLALGPAAD
eukprot:s3284_g3.t2